MKPWPLRKPVSLMEPWLVTAEGVFLISECASAVAGDVQTESAMLIIPRQNIFYLYLDLALVPPAQKKFLIDQRIQQVSPFKHVDVRIIEQKNAAQIWFWDAEFINKQTRQRVDLPSDFVPEPLLREPFNQGLYIQPCINGWDLQYWDNSLLRYSRWFPAEPDARAKADFVRGCGLVSEHAQWMQARTHLLQRPWDEKSFWSKETLVSEKISTRLVVGVLCMWIAMELGMSLASGVKEFYLSSVVANKSEQMTELINQRDAALQQKDFNQGVLELTSAPSQLYWAAQVHECLAGFEFAILEWQYQRGQLTLIVQQAGLDTRALIESCSAKSSFADVRVEPGISADQTRVLFTLAENNLRGGS